MKFLDFGETLGLGRALKIGNDKPWVFTCERCGNGLVIDTGRSGFSTACEICGGDMERDYKQSHVLWKKIDEDKIYASIEAKEEKEK